MCGLMKLGCKILINTETNHDWLMSYLQKQTKLSFVHLCLCFPIYVHILLSFGSLGFLVIIIIAYGNDIVIILDLCLSLCMWCEVSYNHCYCFWKCYWYHFEFVPLSVYLVWGFLLWLLEVLLLSFWICASLCVWLVGVRFLRKCSNLLHSHPIQALNWIGRLYYQSLWLYTKVKYTVLNSSKKIRADGKLVLPAKSSDHGPPGICQ